MLPTIALAFELLDFARSEAALCQGQTTCFAHDSACRACTLDSSAERTALDRYRIKFTNDPACVLTADSYFLSTEISYLRSVLSIAEQTCIRIILDNSVFQNVSVAVKISAKRL